jgi:predicted RNase H-like HicB family nuclease
LEDLPEIATPYTFIVMIRRTRTGYGVDVPDLDGCVSVGLTVEHAKQMIAEAITLHLEGMVEAGEPIPTPRTKYEFAIDEDAGEELCTWVHVLAPIPPKPKKKPARKKRKAPTPAKKR